MGGIAGLVDNNTLQNQVSQDNQAYTLIQDSYFTGVIYSNDLSVETNTLDSSFVGGISGLNNGVVERCYNEAIIYSNSNKINIFC